MIEKIKDTSEPVARVIARQIVEEMYHELYRRIATHSTIFNQLWNSSEASPQEILNELGTSATDVFRAAGANIENLINIAPLFGMTLENFIKPEEYLPPIQPNYHEDGKVTLPS